MTGNKTYYLKYLLTLCQIIVMLADTQSIQGFISSIITPINMCLSEMSDGLMHSKRKMSVGPMSKGHLTTTASWGKYESKPHSNVARLTTITLTDASK